MRVIRIDPNPDFIIKFNRIADVLLDYGWFGSPYLSGGEFDKIYKMCNDIIEGKAKLTREEIEENIFETLMPVIFHPEYRAFYVHRAKELPHLKKFSHYIERAVLHYYKKDYFSCAICLLPAIEGVLLSHYGWEFKQDEQAPKQKKITNHLQNLSKETRLLERYQMYGKTLHSFTKKWIFKSTDKADFSTSYLNRHYALHGLGTGNFYKAADCHRLFLVFDLYTELISIENNIFKYTLIPANEEGIEIRHGYYLLLIEGLVKHSETVIMEEHLLQEHENYHKEINEPTWDRMKQKEEERLENLLKMAEGFRKQNKINS